MSINKVAKLAGVSSSTVSRVINNHPRVAPETAQNVRKAMQELNYTPSDRRPGPKPSFRSRTGVANIAFLVLGTSRSRATPAFEFLLRGVSTGASRNDLNLIFNHLSDPDHIPPRLRRRTGGQRRGRADARARATARRRRILARAQSRVRRNPYPPIPRALSTPYGDLRRRRHAGRDDPTDPPEAWRGHWPRQGR